MKLFRLLPVIALIAISFSSHAQLTTTTVQQVINGDGPAYVGGNTTSLLFQGTVLNTGGVTFFDHAMQDNKTLSPTVNGSGYASIDSIPLWTGSTAGNHIVSFQSRPELNGSGSMGEVIGTSFGAQVNGTTTVNSLYGNQIFDCVGTGCGGVALQVGYTCPTLSAAASNYCIYDFGANPNFTGGSWQMANNVFLNVGGTGSVKAVGTVESTATVGNGFKEILYTPASSSAACTQGWFADDANYHYVCVSANTWKRSALSSF